MNMCVPAKLLLLCLILCDPMDCNSPCSSVRGILQARILEWVAMPFSRGSWLAPKKVTVTVLWSAAHLIHYSFLNPGELLHLRSMLSKSRCTVNCNICSQHWSTERARLFSTTTLDCMSHKQRFKS